MLLYHYTTADTFREAHTQRVIGTDGPRFFAPDPEWAPTTFVRSRRGAARGLLPRDVMLSQGLCRFVVSNTELIPLNKVALKHVPWPYRRPVKRQTAVLASDGVNFQGWGLLIGPRSIADVVSEQFSNGAWERIGYVRSFGGRPLFLPSAP